MELKKRKEGRKKGKRKKPDRSGDHLEIISAQSERHKISTFPKMIWPKDGKEGRTGKEGQLKIKRKWWRSFSFSFSNAQRQSPTTST